MGMPRQIINEMVHDRLNNAVAAGTTTIQSAAVSCNGADNFLFGILMGTITATGTPVISIQASIDGGSTYADLAGSGITLVATTDNNKLILIEIDLPSPLYDHLRVQVTRPTANAVIDAIFVERATMRQQPVVQGVGVHASSKYLVSPAIGAA